MAQVILSSVGAALGGPVGGTLGALLGAAIDNAAINALTPARQVGPRLPELRLTGAAEGAPVPCVFGRGRVGGQVIWAARFRERRIEGRVGGGKGQKTTAYAYSLSFAVAVAEGPIDGLGRVWADGKVMDLSGVTMRLHRGTEDQTPDPLIEAIEGAAPAYRGLAYVVFEDLPLDAFGNRPPQLSFEVFRRPGSATGLEERLRGVCLIPGAGEFVYATEAVLRRDGLTRTTAENVNNAEGRADLAVSLDQLQAQLPAVDHVTLVVSWFGTDLRCGSCQIKPGVDQAFKATIPQVWRAGGVGREDAHRISLQDGGPAYGGTPSDACVLQAIAELKRRGLKVSLYPFVLMDVPPGAGLADPYGASQQGAYPWRGRITCHPAAGRPGSPDGGTGAASQVAAFFGDATPGQVGQADGLPSFSGSGWGFRRMVLHYARLAQLAGGVDGFLIGSELRGLTTVRGAGGTYPAVTALRALATDVRSMVGAATPLGYAADWSEYFGHQPADGSGHAVFHLDPLWADAAIDFVGVDFYPPLTDWREGEGHLDAAAGFSGPHDRAYLRAGLTGGEGFDWFYASPAARDAQIRTPIADGAHGEAWMFRPKDLKSWWSNAHHDRPAGVRSPTPTAWVPRAKPIRLTEFGCPAVDKGPNAPNLFIDPKSAESHLPPFSSGARDDYGQRLALEAVLDWIADPAANPTSPVYGGPMIAAASAWCWDARPFPDFPARTSVWRDGPNWTLGHWLNGRTGIAPLVQLVQALAARAGVVLDPGEAGGAVVGYVVDRPMRLRDALAPLTAAFGLDAVERGGQVRLAAQTGLATAALDEADLAWPDDRPAAVSASRILVDPAQALRLRFIDAARDYQTGALIVRREAGEGSADADAPIVLAAAEAEAVARRMLAGAAAARRETTVHLSPLAALRLEAGDRVGFRGETWRVLRVDLDERPRAVLAPPPDDSPADGRLDWSPAPAREPVGPPVLRLLDLPAASDDARPWVALAAEPWRPFDVHAGGDLDTVKVRARVAAPATVGETVSDLPPASPHRLDRAGRLTVRLEGTAPSSRSLAAVLAGDNALAVLTAAGDWEVIGFTTAAMVGPDAWTLSGLLRGQGDGAACEAVIPAGAPVVLLDEAVVRFDVAAFERGAPLIVRAAPAGGPPAGPAVSEAALTWRGRALTPLAPAHLRVRLVGGDRQLGWIRRDRLGGDVWDGEVALSEANESWRLRVLNGAVVVREVMLSGPGFVHTAAMRAADLAAGTAGSLTVEVAQGSAAIGWGASAVQLL
ncbi:MAG: glycoside hydrolase/phage tail family protein [Alphaproteobacteria bacterium]|nr:glycoside hydrolase/phage tail family protein [Alphaproteobacteria bacterium]